MELAIRYRGRQATSEEVVLIRRLIAENPDDSRRALSVKLCKALNWVQPNGTLRDMVCRGYMLALHRAGDRKGAGKAFGRYFECWPGDVIGGNATQELAAEIED